ncbi:MAG: nucleotidyl transferase AbiEii/AbiGii toxin family protein [Lachnospiraceae bacterium]
MKNAMQLKAIIKNIAKEKSISAQLVIQNFMLERFLERVSVSKYQDLFILKGGFLIAAMVGLGARATMDMDATIKGIAVTKDAIKKMFEEICATSLPDNVTFTVIGIGDIREDDEYAGYCVSILANYPPMQVPLKLDITTGDKITPKEISYEFKLLLEERSIYILAYNLETVLAEKLETVISRGNQNTRSRDFYDVYILSKLQSKNIAKEQLKSAVHATAERRGSEKVLNNYQDILEAIQNSEIMQNHWRRYQKDFEYANDISFEDTCIAVRNLMDQINEEN